MIERRARVPSDEGVHGERVTERDGPEKFQFFANTQKKLKRVVVQCWMKLQGVSSKAKSDGTARSLAPSSTKTLARDLKFTLPGSPVRNRSGCVRTFLTSITGGQSHSGLRNDQCTIESRRNVSFPLLIKGLISTKIRVA